MLFNDEVAQHWNTNGPDHSPNYEYIKVIDDDGEVVNVMPIAFTEAAMCRIARRDAEYKLYPRPNTNGAFNIRLSDGQVFGAARYYNWAGDWR